MHRKQRFLNVLFGANLRPHDAVAILLLQLFIIFASLLVVLFIAVAAQQVQAQTFTVIHNFTGDDGGHPVGGLTIDKAGNLYGTTNFSPLVPCGTVFKLAPLNSGWVFETLHVFTSHGDGCSPEAKVTIGPGNTLYGSTRLGSGTWRWCLECGGVFQLRPAINSRSKPTNATLYAFRGRSDGSFPSSAVIADPAGNLYGTTMGGGNNDGRCSVYGGCGAVYQLVQTSAWTWTENTIHTFTSNGDGAGAGGDFVLDSDNKIYGTTRYGGIDTDYGTVFQLTPTATGWVENILHSFTSGSDGGYPVMITEHAGTLYGTTSGSNIPPYAGSIFKLSPRNGGWEFSVLYQIPNGSPYNLVIDASGNIYGTADGGTNHCGLIFKLIPSNGSWEYTDLHDFTCDDGAAPIGSLVLDSEGNLYGATARGGLGSNCDRGCGVVWKITP